MSRRQIEITGSIASPVALACHALAVVLLSGCGPKDQEVDHVSSPPAEAAAASVPGETSARAPDNQTGGTPATPADARQRSLDAARSAGVLGSSGGGEAQVGPADAWWNRQDACASGSKLQVEDSGPDRLFACVGPDGARQGRFARWSMIGGHLAEEAAFRSGQLDGVQTIYVEGKRTFETTYRRGLADGPYVVYRSDETVGMRGQHRKGQKDGTWTELDAVGGVKATMRYRAGQEHGTWTGTGADGRTWTIAFRKGVVKSVAVKRDGVAIPAGDLASDASCKKMIARARELAGQDPVGALDGESERLLYISCRTRTDAEAVCFTQAASVDDTRRCVTASPPPGPDRKD